MRRRSSIRIFHRAFAVLGLLLVVQTGLAAQLCLALLGSMPAAAQAMESTSHSPAAPCCNPAPEPVDCLANPYGLEPGVPLELPSANLVPPLLVAWTAHPLPEPEADSRSTRASPHPEVPIPIRLHRYLS
jgi:hypothetical protein